MSEFKSYSQAGQDEWVYRVAKANGIEKGLFVDVGCSHPIEINNTYGLERIGWFGRLVDNDLGAVETCRRHRRSSICKHDMTNDLDAGSFWIGLPAVVDYLSLDIDNATLGALKLIPMEPGRLRFAVATIEHDSYRLGNGMRDAIRDHMHAHGYKIAVQDVKHDGLEFEDWWYHPDLIKLP